MAIITPPAVNLRSSLVLLCAGQSALQCRGVRVARHGRLRVLHRRAPQHVRDLLRTAQSLIAEITSWSMCSCEVGSSEANTSTFCFKRSFSRFSTDCCSSLLSMCMRRLIAALSCTTRTCLLRFLDLQTPTWVCTCLKVRSFVWPSSRACSRSGVLARGSAASLGASSLPGVAGASLGAALCTSASALARTEAIASHAENNGQRDDVCYIPRNFAFLLSTPS